MEGKSKKERGNEAVRQFRIREKAKEVADKEKAERLRKENLELESKVASHQQVMNFFLAFFGFMTNRDISAVVQGCISCGILVSGI